MTVTPPPPPPPAPAPSTAPPPAPPGPPLPPFRQELVRLHEDRLWLGVCAAIGRATGTDPVLWRVAIIVLSFFGGSGLVVYGAGWLLIRDESEPRSIADRVLHGRPRRISGTNLVVFGLMGLGALALLELVTPWDGSHGPSLAPLAVVALLAYVVLRRQPAPIGTAVDTAGPAAPAPTTLAVTAAPGPPPYAP
ncbi:MAG: PspC domain protein, partial [Frankiales bacterium]|nr:PspC domain protein [Frankiales bacterium]